MEEVRKRVELLAVLSCRCQGKIKKKRQAVRTTTAQLTNCSFGVAKKSIFSSNDHIFLEAIPDPFYSQPYRCSV